MRKQLWLIALLAAIIAEQAFFGGEEAYKYVNPYALFWIKAALAGLGGGALTLQAFISKKFGEWEEEKKKHLDRRPPRKQSAKKLKSKL